MGCRPSPTVAQQPARRPDLLTETGPSAFQRPPSASGSFRTIDFARGSKATAVRLDVRSGSWNAAARMPRP